MDMRISPLKIKIMLSAEIGHKFDVRATDALERLSAKRGKAACETAGWTEGRDAVETAHAKETLLERGRRDVDKSASKTPDRGLGSSFCCGSAGRRLA